MYNTRLGVLLNGDLSRIPTKGKNDSFCVVRPSFPRRLFKELHLYSVGRRERRGESAPSSGSSAAKTWGVNELPTSESVAEGPQELLVLLEVQDTVPVQVEKLCQFMRTWLFRF